MPSTQHRHHSAPRLLAMAAFYAGAVLALVSANADPFATVCSKIAEEWHQQQIDIGSAIQACSTEFMPSEPSLCGFIGAEGDCEEESDCESGGVDTVECPAGASRTGGCCLIPKIFDCSGGMDDCRTTNGGARCQNTCDAIPMPPAPAPAPVPVPAPVPAQVPTLAPAPVVNVTPMPATLLPPLPAEPPAVGPTPVEVAEPPAVGPEPEVDIMQGPAEVPMEGPAAEPLESDDTGTIGSRAFSLGPVAAGPESAVAPEESGACATSFRNAVATVSATAAVMATAAQML